MNKDTYPPTCQAWIGWALGAALFFIGFYHRVAPAVMTDHLMADFKIGAATLGSFSACYFYSHAAIQVPMGIPADYWGPRRVLTVGSSIAAFGTFLFAVAPTIFVGNMGAMLAPMIYNRPWAGSSTETGRVSWKTACGSMI